MFVIFLNIFVFIDESKDKRRTEPTKKRYLIRSTKSMAVVQQVQQVQFRNMGLLYVVCTIRNNQRKLFLIIKFKVNNGCS